MSSLILYAPQFYLDMSEDEKSKYCNGCGAKGAWYNFLIPFQKVFKEPCKIHDVEYAFGNTDEEKCIADRRFSNNLKRVVDSIENKWKKKILKKAARVYFKSVRDFGEEAFWQDKVLDDSIPFEVNNQ